MNVPLIPDPRDQLAVAHEYGDRLRAEAAAERLYGAPGMRRALAAALRCLARRLDPPPLGASPALR